MTTAGERTATADGTAHELPPGRLRGFEDDDSAPDLASLLSRRAARSRDDNTHAPPPTPDPPPAPQPTVRTAAANPGPATQPASGAKPERAPAPTPPEGDSVTARKNRIRSSSVHIPAALIDRIIAERERSGRSNGGIVIAALEHSHSRLHELIGPNDPTGGSLFAVRPSRGARLSDGPLTPLNVRLYEADYDVIDQLVEQFGAYSRGHLITAALTAYFDSATSR